LENKVLIVSHTFPPAPGVGGRRWAKFAKYLLKSGFDVFVFTSKYSGKEHSLWSNDVNEKLKIYYYKNSYPSVLSKIEMGFYSKLIYRLCLVILKVLSTGNYYDRTIFLKRQFIGKITEKIWSENINNLIISGAPFNLLYYGALIKEKNNQINLIADFRDPWTWGQNYGIANISKKRFKKEKQKESFVLTKADYVLVPTIIMKVKLVEYYPQFENKIKVIEHGFEENLFTQKWKKPLNENVRLAYIGEIYNNIGCYFKEISSVISEYDLKIKIDFYSTSKKYLELFSKKQVQNKVDYLDLVEPQVLFEKLKMYDYVLIIHPKYGKDNISTKFHEIIHFGIPIIYIGERGLTSEFIEKNDFGVYLSFDKIKDFFININSSLHLKPNHEIIKKFSLENITKKLSTLIK